MPSPKRLLLVEDEQDYREDIADFLRQESFEVLTAANGSEGLQQFTNFKPDMVLSDIQMPSLSGLEMLEKMNQHHTHQIGKTPFVFLTAWGDKQYCTSAKTLGCDDFLQKPVDFDMLLTTLHGKLNKWQKVESSFEHDHELMQHVLMHTLRQRIHKPINSMTSYANIMSAVDAPTQQQYVKRIDDIVQRQLIASQCMADTLCLNQKLYVLDHKPTNPVNSLWECAVFIFGFDAAVSFKVATQPEDWHAQLSMDQHLCNRMFGLWMDILSPDKSNPAFVMCEVGRYDRLHITMSKNQAVAEHWKTIDDMDLVKESSELLHRYGCELLFSQAVSRAHNASFSIAESSSQYPAIRWSFAMK